VKRHRNHLTTGLRANGTQSLVRFVRPEWSRASQVKELTSKLERSEARAEELEANPRRAGRGTSAMSVTASGELISPTVAQEMIAAAEAAVAKASAGPAGWRPGSAVAAAAARPASGRTAGEARPGALVRGVTTRAINELVSMERERIVELVGQLEYQHEQLTEQQREIDDLKRHIGIMGKNYMDQQTAHKYWEYDEASLRPASAVSMPSGNTGAWPLPTAASPPA